jgi:hypothetical protein
VRLGLISRPALGMPRPLKHLMLVCLFRRLISSPSGREFPRPESIFVQDGV